MKKNKPVPLMLSIPKECRDKLRTMAAKQNLENPDQVTSASTIAKEIVCNHLSNIANDLGAEQCRIQQKNAA
jgi:hypothetical protein